MCCRFGSYCCISVLMFIDFWIRVWLVLKVSSWWVNSVSWLVVVCVILSSLVVCVLLLLICSDSRFSVLLMVVSRLLNLCDRSWLS